MEVQPRVTTVEWTDDKLAMMLTDGRMVSAPLAWYPRLLHATPAERGGWRVFEDTDGRDVIFCEQLDELIPVVALLAGVPSRESVRSFERWLAPRRTPSHS
ncbi:MAG: DUF2442 domain-containing protein [Caldilineaceae bacterium]|nr:DUF2442 domain-containing protein [Caldilineaceae bacterium]